MSNLVYSVIYCVSLKQEIFEFVFYLALFELYFRNGGFDICWIKFQMSINIKKLKKLKKIC